MVDAAAAAVKVITSIPEARTAGAEAAQHMLGTAPDAFAHTADGAGAKTLHDALAPYLDIQGHITDGSILDGLRRFFGDGHVLLRPVGLNDGTAVSVLGVHSIREPQVVFNPVTQAHEVIGTALCDIVPFTPKGPYFNRGYVYHMPVSNRQSVPVRINPHTGEARPLEQTAHRPGLYPKTTEGLPSIFLQPDGALVDPITGKPTGQQFMADGTNQPFAFNSPSALNGADVQGGGLREQYAPGNYPAHKLNY